MREKLKASSNQSNAQQINGREGETATFLSRFLVQSTVSAAVSPHVISIVVLLLVAMRVKFNVCGFPIK